MGKKVARDFTSRSGERSPTIMCPACKYPHLFNSGWTFNGNYEKPTFTPSMLVQSHDLLRRKTVCHSYVTNGEIRFLGDCTHDMKNQTVKLEAF